MINALLLIPVALLAFFIGFFAGAVWLLRFARKVRKIKMVEWIEEHSNPN